MSPFWAGFMCGAIVCSVVTMFLAMVIDNDRRDPPDQDGTW